MHREITSLNGGTTNLLAYGCDGNGCDYSLRERLDEYSHKRIQEIRRDRQEIYDKGSITGYE